MLSIPDDKLPDEWKDKHRLDSLFSPLRNKSVNPRDWDSKIESWKHLVYLYCLNNEVYTFSLPTLSKAFIRNGRPPSCLGTVVEELIRNGDLQRLDDFLKRTPQTWNGWIADSLIKKPATWSFNLVKNSLWKNEPGDVTYIHLGVVREESQKLVSQIPNKLKNRVISISELCDILNAGHKASNVQLLVHYLEKAKTVAVTDVATDNSGHKVVLVKFADGPKSISETDVGIYVLEQNEKLFIKHVEELEDAVKSCIKDVKAQLLKGNRQLAKTLLKRKHEVEKRLDKKANALHNIQTLLEQLKDAQTNADIWQTYKGVLATFNTTMAQTGLSEDAVEDTMLKLGEVLETHDEIQTAMSRPLTDNDSDLEAELADLLKQPAADFEDSLSDLTEHMKNLSVNLPEVPDSNISIKETSLGC